jgi:uncharacterized protein YukE
MEVGLVADWSVLGLDADPVPGDPGASETSRPGCRARPGWRIRTLIDYGRSRRTAATSRWSGTTPHYLDALHDLPADLEKLATAYHGCGTALRTYSDRLAAAKTQAGQAPRDGTGRTRPDAIRRHWARSICCCHRSGTPA